MGFLTPQQNHMLLKSALACVEQLVDNDTDVSEFLTRDIPWSCNNETCSLEDVKACLGKKVVVGIGRPADSEIGVIVHGRTDPVYLNKELLIAMCTIDADLFDFEDTSIVILTMSLRFATLCVEW